MNFTEAITLAVAQRGRDYVDPFADRRGESDCHYVYVNQDGLRRPGCIIGTALHIMGVPLALLQDQEGEDAKVVIERLRVDANEQEITAAIQAQLCQDRGLSWGGCLDTYNDVWTLITRS